jgi:hypothetical protein
MDPVVTNTARLSVISGAMAAGNYARAVTGMSIPQPSVPMSS